MGSGVESEKMRKQLAAAVRSIQWSYAIFWSISSSEPGVLEWGEGYYNGDIKTRKTIQAMEFNADELSLQRSDQLRELYEFLLAGETKPQARRPSAALSPEDLSNTEWYYLICMSFIFDLGQGLAGIAFANEQPIWLCNAHCADSSLFSRSLLAKSASIQTVVCFPFLGGVIELGVTELVLEDPTIIQHVKTSFLENPYLIHCQIPNSLVEINDDLLDTPLPALVHGEELRLESPNSSSNGFGPIQQTENSYLIDAINEDHLSNCVLTSMTSSDSSPKPDPANELRLQEKDFRSDKDTLNLQSDDLHFQNVLTSLFKCTHQLILGPSVHKSQKKSSFVCWRKCSVEHCNLKSRDGIIAQKMLKKILFEVPHKHRGRSVCCNEEEDYNDEEEDDGKRERLCKPEANEPNVNHALAERRRRERVNERFSELKSLIRSSSKADTKVSILDDTIAYLKELEGRVKELESCCNSPQHEARDRSRPQDMAERTSDNYHNDKISIVKKKRKAQEIDNEEVPEKEGPNESVSVRMMETDVLIEVKSPWRESLLMEIIDAVSFFRLDSHSVQSSFVDGILSLTIKSKLKECTGIPMMMIRQTLQRVVRNCPLRSTSKRSGY